MRRLHARAVPRLARAGHHGRPARAPRRLRVQRRLDARHRRQGPRRGRPDRRRRRRDGLRERRSGAVTKVLTDQGAIEVEQVIVGVGPWVPQIWSMLGLPAAIDIRTPSGDVHRNQDMWTYWYLQEGEIAVDPKMFDRRDGVRAARHPRRHGRAAPRRQRPADHRRVVGHLLQARPARRPGRRRAAHGRPRLRRRPVPDRERGSGVPGHVVRRAVALHGAVQGLPRAVQGRPLRRRRRVHGGQLPGVRLHAAERLRDRRLEPRVQDDRRRPRGREGRLRRPLPPSSIRSASSASRPATCIRSRTRRTPGAEATAYTSARFRARVQDGGQTP